MSDSELNVKLSLIDNITNQLKEINNNISSSSSEMKSNFGALSTAMKEVGVTMIAMGTAIVAQLTLITKSYVDTGTQLTELSETLGFTTEQLSQWGYVAQQNGTSLDALSSHIVYLSRSISDISGSSGVAQKALQDMGLSLSALQAMNPEQQFRTVTEAIANQSNATERLALATSIFGRGAMDLMPILAQGTAGINAEMQQATALGIVMDGQAAAGAQSFSRSLTALKDSFKGLADTIGPIITGILQPLIEKITLIVEGINNWIKVHPGLTKALVDTALILGPLLIAFGTLFTLASTLIITLPILSAVCVTLGISVVFLAGMVGLLTLGLGMIGLGVAALIMNSNNAADATKKASQASYDAAHANDALSQSIKEQTDVLNSQTAAQKAATQALSDHETTMKPAYDQILKLGQAYYYSQTEAGKLGISIDDVTNYLLRQGKSVQQIADIYDQYGADANAVVKGLNLNWNDLYYSVDANIQKLVSSLDQLNNQAKTFNDQLEAWDKQAQTALGPDADATAQALANQATQAEVDYFNATKTGISLPGVKGAGAMSMTDWQNQIDIYKGAMPGAGIKGNTASTPSDMALNSTTNVIVNLDGQPIMNYVNQNMGKAIVQRQNSGG
jgi:hypothetical protein